MNGEVVVAYPPPGKRADPLRHVRSTILTTGMAALKERGRFDDYVGILDGPSREALLTIVAGTWVPVDLALTHYRACDALRLSHDEALAIGAEVGARAHENVLQVVKRIAAGAGVTPWTLAAQYERLWPRMFEGGAFRITRVGPKDGIIELSQFPLAESSYFRSAFCGVNLAGMSLVSTKAYVRLQTRPNEHHGFAIRASWV